MYVGTPDGCRRRAPPLFLFSVFIIAYANRKWKENLQRKQTAVSLAATRKNGLTFQAGVRILQIEKGRSRLTVTPYKLSKN